MKQIKSVESHTAMDDLISTNTYEVALPTNHPCLVLAHITFAICNNRILNWTAERSTIVYPSIERDSCTCLKCAKFLVLGTRCPECKEDLFFFIETKELYNLD